MAAQNKIIPLEIPMDLNTSYQGRRVTKEEILNDLEGLKNGINILLEAYYFHEDQIDDINQVLCRRRKHYTLDLNIPK